MQLCAMCGLLEGLVWHCATAFRVAESCRMISQGSDAGRQSVATAGLICKTPLGLCNEANLHESHRAQPPIGAAGFFPRSGFQTQPYCVLAGCGAFSYSCLKA